MVLLSCRSMSLHLGGLRKDPKLCTVFCFNAAANHCSNQSGIKEEMITPPPPLPEPASCIYSSSNWLFKWTLQPFDQLRHINKLSLCCRCYGWKNLLILPPPPPHQKSAIDSQECIFILIKQNQIISRNTSLTLYWNWPAVQRTLNSAVCCCLLCSFFTSMTINTSRMFWFMLLMCLGAPESVLLSS